MDLIHSTLQASFNARIERLAEQEANELRTIFRFFDTDGDGAVTADQLLRIFGLLGLNINPAYVRDLEEVYMAEFLKIVDSNVPVTAGSTSNTAVAAPNGAASIVPMLTTVPNATASTGPASADAAALAPDIEMQERANAQLWEDEWRVLDSYERGVVSRDELRLFLRSCFSPFSLHDLDRLLELYSDPSMPEDSMTLTKAAFLKFRRDYTARERAQSDHGHVSENEDGDGQGDQPDPNTVEQAMRTMSENESEEPHDADAKQARVKRHISASIAQDTRDDVDGDMDGIFIDPGVMDDEFVDDDDVVVADHHGVGDVGEDNGIFYEDDDEEADGEETEGNDGVVADE